MWFGMLRFSANERLCDAWLCMAMPYAPLLKLAVCGVKVMETLKEEFVNHVEIIGFLI